MGWFGDGGGFQAAAPSSADQLASANKATADAQKKLSDFQKAQMMIDQGYQNRPGIQTFDPSSMEKQAGVTPASYEGTRDVRTGQLLDQYKLNPFAGEASQKLRTEALGTGPTSWAQELLGKQGFEESNARAAAGLQQQQAQSQAQSELARFGGIGGGARTSLARSGARDLLNARQGVGNQGAIARAGIGANDAQLRQQLLGTTADVERQGDLQNLQSSESDINRKALFDSNRYNQQMAAWGAKQSADATRAAGSGGGGGKK